MVKALIRIYAWCLQNKSHEFTRKQIKHLFRGSENEIARWGDWILFGGGMVYKPGGKGSWGLNMERVKSFINGERSIPTRVLVKSLPSQTTEYYDYKYIKQISSLSEFLDEAGQFIAKYE